MLVTRLVPVPDTHKMELQPVTHVWLNRDNDLLDLTLTSTSIDGKGKQEQSSEVIHTNQKHPFLTEEQGFVPAGEIVAGMHLVRADGSVGLVSRWQVVPGVQMMYNLTVAQDHTFTVGNGQWVVHNCGISGLPDPAKKVPDQPNLYTGLPFEGRSWAGWKRVAGTKELKGSFVDFIKSLPDEDARMPSSWKYIVDNYYYKKGAQRIMEKFHYYWYTGTSDIEHRIYHHH